MKIIKPKLYKLQDELNGNIGSSIAFPKNSRLRNEDDKVVSTIEEGDGFEKMIIEATVQGIIDIYGYDKEIAEKIVFQSELKWSIKVAPEMIAHCSKEQLVDMVVD